MTDLSLRSTTPTIDIYIKLAQYPILADRLRDQDEAGAIPTGHH
jgi:hypothetical protein